MQNASQRSLGDAILAFVPGIIEKMGMFLPQKGNALLTRRQFLGFSGLSVLGVFGLYAGEIARHEIDIVYRTIVIPRLPEAFKGFRIVQVSDFHFKEFTEAFFIKLVMHEVNALKVDLVVDREIL